MSNELSMRLEELTRQYPFPQMAVVEALRLARHEGATEEAVDAVAEACEVESDQIRDLIAAWSEPETAEDRQAILCTGLACVLRGAGQVAAQLQGNPERLEFSVTTTSVCLGACHQGPVLRDPAGGLRSLRVEELEES